MHTTTAGRSESRVKLWLLGLALLVLLGTLGAWAFVMLGVYDISATRPHLRPVYDLLELTMRRSVQRRAAGLALPPERLRDPQVQALGAACFRQQCVQCHGAPGVAPAAFALGLQPVPSSLIEAARTLQPEEIHWITRHGIKMSGMPAWEYRFSEAELLAVTAFLSQALPRLSTPQYRQLSEATAGLPCGAAAAPPRAGWTLAGRGELALRQHACTTCHVIPGVVGPDSHVGPSLAGFGRRTLIAGRLANTPENLVRWIRDPPSVDANTAMPALGVSEASAREMAAYLGRLP